MADISHTTGNVGIGTSSPITKLHIAGLGGSTTLTGQAAYGGLHFTQSTTNDAYVGLTSTGRPDSQTTQGGILIQGSHAYGTKIHFLTSVDFVSGMQHRMTLDHLGNLGIGTVSPTAKLDVVGGAMKTNGISAATFTVSEKLIAANIKTTDAPVYPALNSATSGFRYAANVGPYNATNYGTNPAQAYNVSYMRIGRLVVVQGIILTSAAVSAPSALLLGLPKAYSYNLFYTATPSSNAVGSTYRIDVSYDGTMTLQATTAIPSGTWFSVNCAYITQESEQ